MMTPAHDGSKPEGFLPLHESLCPGKDNTAAALADQAG